MADLKVECYADIGNDGNYPLPDKFLGKVTISSLSSTSQSAELPVGTKHVRLYGDSPTSVYFAFGEGSATATTDDQEHPSGLYAFYGKNGRDNDFIAARVD